MKIIAVRLMVGVLAIAASPLGAAERGQVWKSPTCGCCNAWVEYMQTKGFELAVKESTPDELDSVKEQNGVTRKLAGCHSAKIAGYMIEGHVPAQDVERLLAEKPDAIGLSVPGMPPGSPGMKTGDGTVEAFDVLLMKKDGGSEVFARYPAGKPAN